MDSAQLHLALNHFPVVATFLAVPLMAWGWLGGNAVIKKVALAVLLVGAVSAGPAYLTGQRSEERIEHKPAVSEVMIEQHEEAAEGALVAVVITGLIAAAYLFMQRGGRGERTGGVASSSVFGVTAVAALVSAALLGRAAHFGGMIRHDELRGGSVVAAGSTSVGGQAEASEGSEASAQGGHGEDGDRDGDDD